MPAFSNLHLPDDTFLDKVRLVLLAVQIGSHFIIGPESIEFAGTLGATCTWSFTSSTGFLGLVFRLFYHLFFLITHGLNTISAQR